MKGIFATSPAPARVIQYTAPGTGVQQEFLVPPLDATALISTPSDEGVADKAALTVIPTNQKLCNHQPTSLKPPDSYDFREEFTQFTSPIINQGSCGACWAIASTQAFASRYAYYTNQRVQPLSAAYLLYCIHASTFSTSVELQYGCFGGTLVNAYWFLKRDGVVAAECVRYDTLYNWEPSNPNLRRRQIPTAEGITSRVMCPMLVCPAPPGQLGAQPWTYKCAVAYIVAGTAKQSGGSEENIRREIWNKGPVSTGFEVRQDFLTYWKRLLEGTLFGTDLVYVPQPPDDTLNPIIGNHAVQLLGWGAMGSVRYWIVANSWGATNTGDSPKDLQDYGANGYFLMIRGINAAAVESNVVAGIPAIHPTMVNAVGQPAGESEVEMCDLIAYEINRDTFVQLGMDVPRQLPDQRTKFEYTLPPLLSETSGSIRRFTKCPPDRPYRCPVGELCSNSPLDCGTSAPAQGNLDAVKGLVTKHNLASSREVSRKYLAEADSQRKLRRLAVTQTRAPPPNLRTAPIALTVASLLLCTALLVLLLVKK